MPLKFVMGIPSQDTEECSPLSHAGLRYVGAGIVLYLLSRHHRRTQRKIRSHQHIFVNGI